MIYYIILTFYILLPIYLYIKNKHHFLAFWVLQGLLLDIFSVQTHANLSSFKINGLVIGAFYILNLKKFKLDRINILLLFIFSYLLFEFFFFSIIKPWENTTNFNRFNASIVPGLKQLFTNFSEFSLIIYLANYLCEKKNLIFSLKVFYYIGSILIMSIFIEYYFSIDFFHFFTNGKKMIIEGRARGLTYEPRAASQYMAYFIAFVISLPLSRKYLPIIPFAIFAFMLTKSMSGTIVFIFLFTLFFALQLIMAKNKKSVLLKSSLIVSLTLLIAIPFKDKMMKHLRSRSYILNSNSFAEKFEHADYASVSFLIDNPLYILTGVGSGQSIIITSKYKLKRGKRIFKDGYTYLPFMGIILDIINGGLILVLTKLYLIFICIKSFINSQYSNKSFYKRVFIIAILLTLPYFLQIRYMHVYGIAILYSFYIKKRTEDTQLMPVQ